MTGAVWVVLVEEGEWSDKTTDIDSVWTTEAAARAREAELDAAAPVRTQWASVTAYVVEVQINTPTGRVP